MATSAIPDKEVLKRVRNKPKGRTDFGDINEALSNFAAEEVYFFHVAHLHYLVASDYFVLLIIEPIVDENRGNKSCTSTSKPTHF